MISAKRWELAVGMVLLVCASLRAQGWEVGGSAGLVNDVKQHVDLSGFKHQDLNLWVGLETAENVVVRATVGSLRVQGSNAGVTPTGMVAALPELPDRINYLNLGVAYIYEESVFTSALFAGIGGYRIEPDATSPSLSSFRDRDQSAWGLHAGVDGNVKIASHVSLVLRLTYHNIRSSSGRSLLTADGGLAYRF